MNIETCEVPIAEVDKAFKIIKSVVFDVYPSGTAGRTAMLAYLTEMQETLKEVDIGETYYMEE